MATLLEIQNVSQYYGPKQRRFLAVQDVSLAIDEGQFVALLGPSGCGKSTLLRVIVGLSRPSEGQVLYRGEPVAGVNQKATIVFQSFALFPWLTVQENVEVALKARGLPDNVSTLRALDQLDKVGLNGFETAYPRELSGGMRQKVGFARALALNPELLCLDEPFSALDVLSAESLRTELLELWASGAMPTKAVLVVTHNIEEAVSMADRVVIMDKNPGRIVADLKLDLPRPRVRKSPLFLELIDRVYGIMAGQTTPEEIETAATATGGRRLPPLAQVNANDLIGLAEQLAERPGCSSDIFRLADELQLDSDRLLRITDGLEALGFAMIAHGDITLTPLGETFAEADAAVRKRIFAMRTRRLPLFRWLLGELAAAEHTRLPWDEIKEKLGEEFLPDEAENQMNILVDWGRYGELLAYDDDTGLLHLEPEPPRY